MAAVIYMPMIGADHGIIGGTMCGLHDVVSRLQVTLRLSHWRNPGTDGILR
jgi:hypothetical protein